MGQNCWFGNCERMWRSDFSKWVLTLLFQESVSAKQKLTSNEKGNEHLKNLTLNWNFHFVSWIWTSKKFYLNLRFYFVARIWFRNQTKVDYSSAGWPAVSAKQKFFSKPSRLIDNIQIWTYYSKTKIQFFYWFVKLLHQIPVPCLLKLFTKSTKLNKPTSSSHTTDDYNDVKNDVVAL